MHTKPISAVDQRRPPLGLFDEIPKEMGLGIVEHFDAAFRYDTTIIGLGLLDVAQESERNVGAGVVCVCARRIVGRRHSNRNLPP